MAGTPRFAPALLALGLAACGRSSEAVEPRTDRPAPADQSVQAETVFCADAPCLVDKASAAEAAGLLDVASRYLAYAYATDPTASRLEVWLESLKKSGQNRALAQAIDEAGKTHPEVASKFHPPAPQDKTVVASPSDSISEALALERAGEAQAAADLLASSDHPTALARRGIALSKLAATKQAARSFAQSRIALDERGATIRLAPFETTYSTGLAWHDDHAVRIAGWRSMDVQDQITVTALEHLSPGDRFDVVQELLVRTSLHATAAPRLYGHSHWRSKDDPSGVEVYELGSGASMGVLEVGDGNADAARVLDAGLDRRYLAKIVGQDITISLPEGKILGTFSIDGTTPTITRAYTGEGSHHDNILNNDPSWPVAFAVSDNAKHVAIGASDSTVHLFRVGTRFHRKLEVKWEYKERRHMGGNADHNRPVALGFASGSHEFVAVYSRGDIVWWGTDGRKRRHHPGRCGKGDLESYAGRYGTPRGVTDDDRAGCRWFQQAWLSPSGDRVATTGPFDLRVVDTRTGKSVVAHIGENLGADSLAWADERNLVFSNLYGQVWQWQEGQGVASRTEKRDGMTTGPRSPRLSSDLRVLQWGGDYRPIVAWDLFSGTSLTPAAKDDLVGVTPSGSLAYRLSRSGQGMAVSNAAGKKVYPFEQASAERIVFVNESGRQLIARRDDGVYFVDLVEKREQELAIPATGRAGSKTDYRASLDGSRVAILGGDMTLRVFRTLDGALAFSQTLKLGEQRYRGDFALAPDGSWLAWQEQLERPANGLPSVRVHVVGIDPAVQSRTVEVKGWANILEPHPEGGDLLIATENTLSRLDVNSGTLTDEGFEYVGVNSLHFSADGSLVIFERYGQVDIRANAPKLPVLASVYSLDNGGWFVQTQNGAVDGSDNAHESLATVVDGPIDSSVLPGQVGWDRFAVPHLMAQPRGYEAKPPGAR